MIIISSLETDVADHCNLKCKHCAHHSPYLSRSFYSVSEFEKDIKSASAVLHSEWFKVIGGEPLLNKDLFQYIEIIKKYNISDNIAIFTNGILLDRVGDNVLDSINVLSVSEYPLTPILNEKIKSNILNVRKSYPNLTVIHNYYDTFDAQEFTKKNDDGQLVKKIWDRCKLRFECNTIYRGYFSKCIVARRKRDFLLEANCVEDYDALNTLESDNCNLHTPNLRERFLKYYFSDTPLDTCKWCVGSCGKSVPHRQNTDRHIEHNTISDVIDVDAINKPSLITQDRYPHVSPITRQPKYSTIVDSDGIHHVKKT